jgi:hypothetical protein
MPDAAAELRLGERSKPKRPLDITIFGILFLISAPIELLNIMSTDWTYSPKFFGFILTGTAAKAYLVAQPILHLALGYGFLTLRRWALYLALFYAADTLTSAVSSLILIGYGRIRTIFIAVLVPFVIYLAARRRLFTR